jgi:hypothetical protein
MILRRANAAAVELQIGIPTVLGGANGSVALQ